MGTPNVWILGGYQSDFARNFTREGHDFADLTAEVVDNTLTAAKVDAGDIEVVHVANAFGEMFARQAHLGAMPATVNAGLCAANDPYVLPHVPAAALDAFDRARVTLDDVDGFEVHDCFTPSEYLTIDHIGLTGPGESWKAIENNEIELGGRLPINPSGGLIGGGHPVGATGVRMLVDAAKQVSGTAGDYQVEGAKTFGTLNFGGSTATTVGFIVSGV
jgi:acetyl-CoA acetyltransferase